MSNLKLPQIASFEDAKKLLNGKTSRKIAYATQLAELSDNCIAVIHHETDIVRFHKDGTLSLHTGGYVSVTTGGRLHRFVRSRGWRVNTRPSRGFYIITPPDGDPFEWTGSESLTIR